MTYGCDCQTHNTNTQSQGLSLLLHQWKWGSLLPWWPCSQSSWPLVYRLWTQMILMYAATGRGECGPHMRVHLNDNLLSMTALAPGTDTANPVTFPAAATNALNLGLTSFLKIHTALLISHSSAHWSQGGGRDRSLRWNTQENWSVYSDPNQSRQPWSLNNY